MKNVASVVLIAFLLIGCGGKKEETAPGMAQSAKKDYISEGMRYLKEKDITRAVRSFDLAIKQEPANPNNYLMLGQIYLRLKDAGRAADTFEAATKVSPNSGDAYFFLGISRAIQQRQTEAIAAAQKSVDIFMQARDEERFKRSVALLKGLSSGASGASADISNVIQDATNNSPITQ